MPTASWVTAHGLYERRFGDIGQLEEPRPKASGAAGAAVAEFRYEPEGAAAGLRHPRRRLGSCGTFQWKRKMDFAGENHSEKGKR